MWPPSILLSRALYICCNLIIPFDSIRFDWFSRYIFDYLSQHIHLFETPSITHQAERGAHEIRMNSCGATSQFLPLRTAEFTNRQTQNDFTTPPSPPPGRGPTYTPHTRATPSSPIDNSQILSTIQLIKVYTFFRVISQVSVATKTPFLFFFPKFLLILSTKPVTMLAPCILGLKDWNNTQTGCVIG